MGNITPSTRRGFLKTVGVGTATLACGPRMFAANPALVTHGGSVGGVRPEAMLEKYLDGLAFAALDRRQAVYEALKTPEDIRAYQTRLRGFFIQQLGGFPERTPLNARVVGQLQADGYRIEKVIYESLPRVFGHGQPLPAPHPGAVSPACSFPAGTATTGRRSKPTNWRVR